MAYLYRHIRVDQNKPFYIGIGSDKDYNRAYDKTQRNKYWKHIVNKTSYCIEIVLDNLTWEEAQKKEIEFITLYGRKDLGKGMLCNMTNGGEGNCGRVTTEEVRNKISKSVKENSHWKNGRKHTLENIKKIKQASLTMNRIGIGEKISKGKKGKAVHINSYNNLIKGPFASAKQVKDIVTNIIYFSISEAAKSIDMKPHCLRKKLSGQRKNNTNFILI
jgi:hypothetical protein